MHEQKTGQSRILGRLSGWGVLLVMGTWLSGCAALEVAEPRLTPQQQQLNVESFDVIWETIRDKHFDKTLGGLDWDAVRGELRPQVARAQTMAEARAAMADAIGRLKLSHHALIPQEAFEVMETGTVAEGDGRTGLVVRVLDGQALVLRTEDDAPAGELGVQPGWRIVQIDDKALQPMLDKIAETYPDDTRTAYMLAGAVNNRLAGPVGETVQVTFEDGVGEEITLDIPRIAPAGKQVRFGHLPPMYLHTETRQLKGDIGYFAFNVFFDPSTLMPAFQDAVLASMDARGMVVDVRGNPGGIGALAMGMAGWFVSEADKPMGTMKTRQMDLKFVVFPRPETFRGPVAILVDGCSGSTAEIFAGGMQTLGRARVFGRRTAGAALPSKIEKLPNGDGFQWAMGDYITSDGVRLEGHGVLPDVVVVPTREQLLAGRDPVLDAAVEWIRSQD